MSAYVDYVSVCLQSTGMCPMHKTRHAGMYVRVRSTSTEIDGLTERLVDRDKNGDRDRDKHRGEFVKVYGYRHRLA